MVTPWVNPRLRSVVPMTTPDPRLRTLGDEDFVSLTTFRRSGDAVSTPVWIARDGEDLIAITPSDSGKVKRIKNSERVELRPCTRRGKVSVDAVPVPAVASIETGDALERGTAVIKKKYGFEFRAFMLVEFIIARGRKPRVLLRISSANR